MDAYFKKHFLISHIPWSAFTYPQGYTYTPIWEPPVLSITMTQKNKIFYKNLKNLKSQSALWPAKAFPIMHWFVRTISN